MTELRTTIAPVLDDVAPDVAAVRAQLDPVTAARWPFHLTLLHPFVSRRELDPERIETLTAFCRDRRPLSFTLTRVEAFPEVVAYAAPEPVESLTQLMRDLWERFPETPPYGGACRGNPTRHAVQARAWRRRSENSTRSAHASTISFRPPVSWTPSRFSRSSSQTTGATSTHSLSTACNAAARRPKRPRPRL